MRINHVTVLGVILLTSLLSLNLLTQSTQTTNQLKKSIDAWVSMWNTYDLSQVQKLFLKNDQVSYFSSEKEGVLKGINAIIEHHKGFGFVDGGKVQGNKLWLENILVQSFDSVKVVTGIWFFKRTGPSVKIQKGPVTIVYVKFNKKNLIAHMHFANYIEKKASGDGA